MTIRLDPRSVDAFDDAEVALDAVGESDQRFLVGRALVRRDPTATDLGQVRIPSPALVARPALPYLAVVY